MRRRVIALIVILIALGAGAWWWFDHNGASDGTLTLYGNVDLREVSTAFNGSGRVAEVLVDEGDVVSTGEVLARLDTSLLQPQAAQANAQVAAQAALVDKLHNGNLPEEIGQARANVDSATANAKFAKLSYERLLTLQSTVGGEAAVTQSQIDQAKATYDAAAASQTSAEQALILAELGPREEDITQAEATLKSYQAAAALAQQQLDDAVLTSPTDGIVRSRLLEPGEMASTQLPVLSLAIVQPKWVRAYVSEPDLPRIHSGMAVKVSVDGGGTLDGTVGFISSVAEFTPSSIQTEDLRTSLVYEVRIWVDDPDNVLRLGMPATVRVVEDASPANANEGQ